MSYILFSGDSWTNENYSPSRDDLEAGIPKLDLKFYSEQLSDKFQKKRVNLAESGNSYGKIVFDTLEYLFNNPKPDLVVVQLSSFVRFAYKGWENGQTAKFQQLAIREEYSKFYGNHGLSNNSKVFSSIKNDELELTKIAVNDFLTTELILDTELLYILSLVKYLEEMNIKYIIFFGLYLWHKNNDQIPVYNTKFKEPTIFRYAPHFLKRYIDHKYFRKIDEMYEDKILGWPGDYNLSGFNFYELKLLLRSPPAVFDWHYYYNKELNLIDNHPSQSYHNYMTEKIYEFIKEKYKTI